MDFKLKTRTVEFIDSDGQVIGSLTVTQPRLENDQRRAEMEEAAAIKNIAEITELNGSGLSPAAEKIQSFRVNIYPKLAACSSGDIPNEQTAYDMPAEELYKWYNAAHEVAPEWFRVFDEIAEAYQKSKAAGEAVKKKKDRKESVSQKNLKSS